MFEKHQHKEQFLKDTSQKQEINKFSEESQQWLVDMNQTEIFEHCENSAKLQCSDCNAFREIGIVYCSCGRNLKYSWSLTTTQKTKCDFASNPWLFVIEKSSSRGPSTAYLNDRSCSTRRNGCLRKHDGMHKKDTESQWRNTLLAKKTSMLYDRIALERHDFIATKAERLQNAKHWILRFEC